MKNKFIATALISSVILLSGSGVANAGNIFSFGFYAPEPVYIPRPVYVAEPVYPVYPAYFPDCRYYYCNYNQRIRFHEWQERRWERHERHEKREHRDDWHDEHRW